MDCWGGGAPVSSHLQSSVPAGLLCAVSGAERSGAALRAAVFSVLSPLTFVFIPKGKLVMSEICLLWLGKSVVR